MRLLAACLLGSLAACGGSTSEPARTEPSRAETAPTDEPASHDEPGVTRTAPRRIEVEPGRAPADPVAAEPLERAAPGVPREARPSVPPPPVEPPR